jgi:hypothetical protein
VPRHDPIDRKSPQFRNIVLKASLGALAAIPGLALDKRGQL